MQSEPLLKQCSSFKSLNITERRAVVHSKQLCFNCFQLGHIADLCPHAWTCNIEGCGKKHNRWLHPVSAIQEDDPNNSPIILLNSDKVSQPNSNPSQSTNQDSTSGSTISAACVNQDRVALPITTVNKHPTYSSG